MRYQQGLVAPTEGHRGDYTDLVVENSRGLGSCAAWSVFIRDYIVTSLISSDVFAISLLSSADLAEDLGAAKEMHLCNGTTAQSIIQALVQAARSPSVNMFESFTCNRAVWSVGVCSAESPPFLCVGCNRTACLASTTPLSILMHSSACSIEPETFHVPTLLNFFTVSFKDKSVPADVLSVTAEPSSSSIELLVTLNKAEGSLICAAVSAETPVVVSDVGQLLLWNGRQVVDVKTAGTAFVLRGLVPASAYDVYCATLSQLNVPLPPQAITNTRLSVTTLCCRDISVQLQTNRVITGHDVADALRVSLSGAVPVDLTLHLQAFKDNSTVPLFPFIPSQVQITSTAPVRFAFIRQAPGNYRLGFTASGSSASHYRFSYSVGSVSVVQADNEPAAPTIISAVFAGDGSFVTVTFDSPTNRAGYANNFQCQKLFDMIHLSVDTRCLWADAATVFIYTRGDGGVRVGDKVKLFAGTVKARCEVRSSVSLCSSWAFSDPAATVLVRAPPTPSAPIVSIVAAAVVGPCDSLLVDISGSTGSGGRSFQSIEFLVEGTHANTSHIASLLNSPHNIALPYDIPGALLAPGHAYNIIVTLCNFIGGCGRGAHSFVVSSSLGRPVVSLNTGNVRSMLRSSQLLLSGRAYVSLCGGVVSTSNLHYRWQVRVDGVDHSDTLFSRSNDPRVLLLPPNSLEVGQLYTVTLTAQNTVSLQSSSSSTLISVERGKVGAVIAGSAERGLRLDDVMIVDASSSYDQDNTAALGAAAGLLFHFSCTQVSPSFQESCELTMALEISGDILIVSVPSGVDLVDTVHVLTVTVTSPIGWRTSTASVTITVLTSLAPLVTISSVTGQRINPSQKLKLLANVQLSSAGSATWSIDDPEVQLSALSLSSIQRELAAPQASLQGVSLSLVLPPHSLPQESSLVFKLSVTTLTGHAATAAISISTNSPPLSGEYSVSPPSGVMMSTRFSFSATHFEDSDLPVTYEFAYQSTSGSYLVHRARLEKSFTESELPNGRASTGDLLSTRLQVFDRMDAVCVVYESVEVKANHATAAETQNYLVSSLASGAGYADEVKRVVAVTSCVINSVNCSLAPNCSLLHRAPCSTSPGTCGECILGYFGEFGHANSLCLSGEVNQRRLLSVDHLANPLSDSICSSDADCEVSLWQVCGPQGTCIIKSKECSNDCNGVGDCVFVSVYNSSQLYSHCSVLHLHCNAMCVCTSGYSGRSCEVTALDHELTVVTRHRLMQAIREVSLQEDVSPDTLVSWLESIAALCSDPTALAEDTKALVTAMTIEFLSAAKALSLPTEDLLSVAAIVDLVLGLGSAGDKASLKLLATYNNFIVSDMADGQNTMHIIGSSFRSSFYALDGRSVAEVAVPATPLETFLGAAQQSARIPVSNEGTPLKVSVVETLAVSGNESVFESVPLSLRFDRYPCGEGDNNTQCAVVVVLQIVRQRQGGAEGNNSVLHSHSAECRTDIIRNVSYSCPDGEELILGCNGSAGVVTGTCPLRTLSMLCASVGADRSHCEVEAYTPSNITCKCVLPVVEAKRRRHLQAEAGTEGEDDTSVSVDVASVTYSVLTTFVSTWQGAGGLTAQSTSDSIQVLITVSFVGIVAVVCIVYAALLDRRDCLQQHAEEAHAFLGSVSKRRDAQKRTVSPGKVEPTPVPYASNNRRALTLQSSVPRSVSMSDIVLGMLGVRLASAPVRPRAHVPQLRKMNSRVTGQMELRQIEDSLPAVLRPLPLWMKYSKELQMHHRWVGVVCHYSPAYSRPLRVMSLVMNILTMLLIEALTYDIAYPDDGSCEKYTSTSDCLAEESALSRGESKCYWDADRASCHIKEVENDLERVILVAMLAAVISTPFAVLFQSLILFVLSAETIDPLLEEQQKTTRRISAAEHARSKKSLGGAPPAISSAPELLGPTFTKLMTGLRTYREGLSDVKRQEFDSTCHLLWQLPPLCE